MTGPAGWCELCEPPTRVDADELLEHLERCHPAEYADAVPFATWPDGSLVVIDETLEPDDFEQELEP